MPGSPSRARSVLRRVRRFERRELQEFRDWIENTQNLIHVSILVLLPLLIAFLTFLANAVDLLPFLLFPPLASGTYTLFAHPESRYASPRRFVGGLTTGAICGWIALEVTARYLYGVRPEAFHVHPGAAAFGVFLTGVVTWGLDIEESSAFSAALLVLVTGVTQILYVASVVVSTAIIAAVFIAWRSRFYERRAEFLYQSTRGDDHVLVPVRGGRPDATAMLAGRLAAAHDAGKVVLLEVVSDREIAKAERALLEEGSDRASRADGQGPSVDVSDAERRAAEAAVVRLEERAAWITDRLGVVCEVIVAVGGEDPAGTVLHAARENNCDLVVAPYEASDGRLTPFLRELLQGEIDVVVHKSVGGRTRWERVLVPVRRAGDVAHAMIDFARRLGEEVSVCHCIESPRQRRDAEDMLANLVETVSGSIETRVARASIEEFLERNAGQYDIVFLGASTDRSAASRLLSRPTFQRILDLECDIGIVHRG